MNYKEFAQKYLEDAGAFDKESNYGGMLGPAIMKLVQAFSGEGHSGGSAFITNEAFYDLNNAYASEGKYKTKRHKVWSEYWASPEGQKLQSDAGTPGVMNED
jgi:hypothetical protein